jgi:hypothetical protein
MQSVFGALTLHLMLFSAPRRPHLLTRLLTYQPSSAPDTCPALESPSAYEALAPGPVDQQRPNIHELRSICGGIGAQLQRPSRDRGV